MCWRRKPAVMATISIPGMLRAADETPDLDILPQFYLAYKVLPVRDLVLCLALFDRVHDHLLLSVDPRVREPYGSQLTVAAVYGAMVQTAYYAVLTAAAAYYFVLNQKRDAKKKAADAKLSATQAEQIRAELDARQAERFHRLHSTHPSVSQDAVQGFQVLEESRLQSESLGTFVISDGETLLLRNERGKHISPDFLEFVYDDFRGWLYETRRDTSGDISDIVTEWLEIRGLEFVRNWAVYIEFNTFLVRKGYIVIYALSYHDYQRRYRLKQIRKPYR